MKPKLVDVFCDDPPNIVVWTEVAGSQSSWSVKPDNWVRRCDPETGEEIALYYATEDIWWYHVCDKETDEPVTDKQLAANLTLVLKAAESLRLSPPGTGTLQ